MTLRSTRKFLVVAVALLFIVTGCGSSDEKPAEILSHSQMVRALTDIYLAEQTANQLGIDADSAKFVFSKLKAGFFEKRKFTDSIFNKSFHYYIDRPLELEEIYVALVDSLTLAEQRLNVLTPAAADKK